MRKRKVTRAINPNLGRQAAFQKRLKRLYNDFGRMILEDCLLYISSQSVLAEDDSLTNPRSPKERAELRRLMARINASIKADPELFRANMNAFIERNKFKWLERGSRIGESVARWYCQNCAVQLTRTQKANLISAGVNPSVFTAWKLPVIAHAYVSPTLYALMPAIVQETASKITGVLGKDIAAITQAVVDGFAQGNTLGTVLNVVRAMQGMTESRAQFIARDQTNRITERITIANDTDIGITQGIWIHRPGKYTSRETHIEMNNKPFNLKEGLFDPHVGYNVIPGELINCRCVYRADITSLLDRK